MYDGLSFYKFTIVRQPKINGLHSLIRKHDILKLIKRIYKPKDQKETQRVIYDSYADPMFALCMRYLRNKEDAEECLTNGFLKIFDNQNKFESQGEGSFERWMRTIIINECLMYLRKRKIFDQLNEKQNDRVDELTTDHNLHYQEIYDLVLRMPDGYRTVFCLYHIEGYSHKEVAEKCGISESTSKSQLSKARNFLQNQLKKQEVYHEI